MLPLPDLGLGRVQGTVALGMRRLFAFAVRPQHLDLLLCRQLPLDGRLDEVDVQRGNVEQVVVGEVGGGGVFGLGEAGAVG